MLQKRKYRWIQNHLRSGLIYCYTKDDEMFVITNTFFRGRKLYARNYNTGKFVCINHSTLYALSDNSLSMEVFNDYDSNTSVEEYVDAIVSCF